MKHILLSLAVVGLFIVGSVSPALPCGNAYRHEVDNRVRALERAGRAMRLGSYRMAISHVFRSGVAGKEDPQKVDEMSSMQRAAVTVLALSVMRSDGKYGLSKKPVSLKKATARRSNLEWAHRMLEAVHKRSPDQPGLESFYAESLARIRGDDEKAYEILRRLDTKDLLSSPHGYALLARLADQRGESKLAVRAHQRCKSITARDALCGPAPAPATDNEKKQVKEQTKK